MFIENEFLEAAIAQGERVREETYRLPSNDEGEEGEEGAWLGISRFVGLYVVNVVQYGEGGEDFGPFGSRKEADAVFNLVDRLYTP